MVWWLRRLVEGRDPVQDERLGFRPGLFSAYDAWGEWSLRLGYQKLTRRSTSWMAAPWRRIANGADDPALVVFFYSDRSKRDRAAKARTATRASPEKARDGRRRRRAQRARLAGAAARPRRRVRFWSEAGLRLPSQEGANGAMSLPLNESAIYGWAARLAVGPARHRADGRARAETSGVTRNGTNLRREPLSDDPASRSTWHAYRRAASASLEICRSPRSFRTASAVLFLLARRRLSGCPRRRFPV